QLVMAASAEIGSTTRSELVASAAARLGPAALSGDDLDDRLRAYRKSSTDDLLRDPIDPEAAEKLPRHSGLTLPEPLHILLKEIQYVSLSHPKQSEIAGLAVSELAQAGDSAAGEAVMSYRKATVGDLFSDHSA
ncbi:MAG TPA: hypothetical protein VHA37_05630, partial [Candidatus Saccharimonadales bacterium]|nr:hypothetical protein [Candidatus Saccharimonadales bacterium]